MSSLAAARADNFYYPPGWTPEKGSLNKYHGQHALRERARKLGEGILIIRFEMPFHVWCGGCGAMIAKGVRFNAEKKQIGNYHSTKIWSFTMKAACCQHSIEIHTDPKNCDYVVVSGAQKKVVDYDAEEAGTSVLPTEEEKEKLADPLYRVEHSGEDAKRAHDRRPELVRMKQIADARHADTWQLNSRLRAELRVQKKRVAAEEEHARSQGLGMRLLPSEEEDRQGAAATVFRPKFEDNRRDKRAAIKASSIFSSTSSAAAVPVTSRVLTGVVHRGRLTGATACNRSSGSHHTLLEASCGAGNIHQKKSTSAVRNFVSNRKVSQSIVSSMHKSTRSSSRSGAEHKAQLAAKRRKIDARGVLEVAVGKAS